MIRFNWIFIVLLVIASSAVYPAEIPTRQIDSIGIDAFQIANGMEFLVVRRPAAPQIAARVVLRAGSALEESGKTGIAHMLEHMMFKGTKNFGTLDPNQDEQLQRQIEAAYQTILAEQNKRTSDEALIREKRAEMESLRLEVQKIFVPQAFSAQLGKNGAVGINAFTSQDQTQYMMSIPSDMIEQWFSIVSEQLFEPSWREFYVEKEVVQREWAYRYVNNPEGAAWLDLYATAYTAHPYRNPVIGWLSDMQRLSTLDAVAFHRTYYNPTNTVCVLVGDVSPKRAKDLAEIYFGRYPAGRRATEKVTEEPIQQGPRKCVRFLKGARTPIVRIGFHSAPMGTPDFYALDVLTMVLSQGRGARLTRDVVDKGLAMQAWSYNPDARYGGLVILGGSPNEPAEAGKDGAGEDEKRRAYMAACESFEGLLLAQVEKLKQDPVSNGELQRIKKLNERDFLDRMRTNEDLAGAIATFEVQIGRQYLQDYLVAISTVTPDDIRRVAQTYFRSDNQTSIYVIPGGRADRPAENYAEIRSLSGSAATKVEMPQDFENHSAYPTPSGWKHPLSFERKPHKIDYPKPDILYIDKTPVVYLHDDSLPLIDLTLIIKAGAVDLDQTKTGLTDILGDSLVRGGTQTTPPAELALALDEHAVQISVSIQEEETQIHLFTMTQDWHAGLGLLKEILLYPGFDGKVFEVIREQKITALKRQNEDARAVAMREAEILQFQGHPYGRDPQKGIEMIPTIRRKDLQDFVKRFFIPRNMVVAISGDIDRETAEARVKDFLEDFPKHNAPRRRLVDPVQTPPALYLIHKPGQVQSQVSLRLPSVKRTHPDYWKTNLLMSLFGGQDSLLSKRLRDDLGLVYSTWFYQGFKWQAGFLAGYIGCKADQTAAAIRETTGIMERLRQEVPRAVLDLKRLDALNSFIFNVDSAAELARVYGCYFLRGEPLDTLDRIQAAFLSVSEKELAAIAGKTLDPGKLQIVIVADKFTKTKKADGTETTVEEELRSLSADMGLPFRAAALE